MCFWYGINCLRKIIIHFFKFSKEAVILTIITHGESIYSLTHGCCRNLRLRGLESMQKNLILTEKFLIRAKTLSILTSRNSVPSELVSGSTGIGEQSMMLRMHSKWIAEGHSQWKKITTNKYVSVTQVLISTMQPTNWIHQDYFWSLNFRTKTNPGLAESWSVAPRSINKKISSQVSSRREPQLAPSSPTRLDILVWA